MDMFNNLTKLKNSKEWIEFEKYYGKTSILEQINFFRFEDAHTNFLASLLNENNPYGLGDYPLQLLCELIASKDIDNKFPHIKTICMSSSDLSNIETKIQEKLPSGRIDLLIKFDVIENEKKEQYLIALEAKLDSLEHDEQCKNYREDLDKSADYNSYKKTYLYLSLSKDDSISDEEHYLKFTYQDLINYVYEPCSYKSYDNNLLLTLNEYINSFSSLYFNEKFDINYIPITTEGKKLTLQVWNKNEKIIKEFIDGLLKDKKDDYVKSFFEKNQKLLRILFINLIKMNDIHIEREYFDTMNRIAENIRERNKLNDKYYSDTRFIYEVFKDIISKVPIEDYKQLDKINKNKFIYSQEEYAEAKTKSYHTIKQYGTLSIPKDSKNYYYYSINNKPEEILELIELIKEELPYFYNDDNLKRVNSINEILKNKEN